MIDLYDFEREYAALPMREVNHESVPRSRARYLERLHRATPELFAELRRLRGVEEAARAFIAGQSWAHPHWHEQPHVAALRSALAARDGGSEDIAPGTTHDECAFASGRHAHLPDGRVGAARDGGAEQSQTASTADRPKGEK